MVDSVTYDLLQQVPLSSQIGANMRHDLVRRLDAYLINQPVLFKCDSLTLFSVAHALFVCREAILYIESKFIPDIRRHAMAGRVLIRTYATALSHFPFLICAK